MVKRVFSQKDHFTAATHEEIGRAPSDTTDCADYNARKDTLRFYPVEILCSHILLIRVQTHHGRGHDHKRHTVVH